jgi:hypothetical protein
MHSDKNILNVVLHGLFLIHVRHDHIELLSPMVHEHVYYAGNRIDKLSQLKGQPMLKEGQVYSLVGVNQFMECPPITHHLNTVVSTSAHGCEVHSHRSHLIVRLPFPDDIIPLRSLQDHPIYAGKDAGTIFADGVSLCQVFVYPVMTFDNARLSGTNWKPAPFQAGSYCVANLHIWAEPTYNAGRNHVGHAYRELMKLIPPLDLDLVEDKFVEVPKDDPDVIGIKKEDLKGLADLPPMFQKTTLAQAQVEMTKLFGAEMAERIIEDRKKAAVAAGKKEEDGGDHGSRVTNCQSITVTG